MKKLFFVFLVSGSLAGCKKENPYVCACTDPCGNTNKTLVKAESREKAMEECSGNNNDTWTELYCRIEE